MNKILSTILLFFYLAAKSQTNHYFIVGDKLKLDLKQNYNFENLLAESPSVSPSLFYIGYTLQLNKSFITANFNSILFNESQYSQSGINIDYAYTVFKFDKNDHTFYLQPTIGIGRTSDYVRGKGINNSFIELRNNLYTFQYGFNAMVMDKKGEYASVNICHLLSNSSNWRNVTLDKNLNSSYSLNQLQIDFRLGFRFGN
jgi:hypothetical protein